MSLEAPESLECGDGDTNLPEKIGRELECSFQHHQIEASLIYKGSVEGAPGHLDFTP